MIPIVLATVIVAGLAGAVYLGREGLGAEGLGLAALRTVAMGALFLALFNPSAVRRVVGGSPTVLLDASLSMGAAGAHWNRALDTARALAGSGDVRGSILRFGSRVSPYDSAAPTDGMSSVRDALEASVARSGPVYIVSDGEIPGVSTLSPSVTRGTASVLVPRDTVPDAALLEVSLPDRVQREDSIVVSLVIGTWGGLDTSAASIEIFADTRRLLRRSIQLPPPPGVARRTVVVPAGVLGAGTHVLRFRLDAANDEEDRDDERFRIVTVTSQPAIVVIVDPADLEGRFLVNELSEVARTTVRGFARVQNNRWLDMATMAPTPESAVRSATQSAGLVFVRGRDALGITERARAVWYWPAGADETTELFDGDWYVTVQVPASPLAGRLAPAAWDSVPPLTGIVPLVPAGSEWIALTGRLARRGPDRPLLVGEDSSGTRRLTTAGTGLWRWVLRGGASREAYRALVAAGTDWLFEGGSGTREVLLTADGVAAQGVPVRFRWHGPEIPDSAVVTLSRDDSIRTVTVRFDGGGVGLVALAPGTYRWSTTGVGAAQGLAVVESYSDEFHPQAVTLGALGGGTGFHLIVRRAREFWWLFVIAMAAFLVEWGWRQRRGLP